jgi:hypothetical protein
MYTIKNEPLIWEEKKGLIYLTLPATEGKTGKEWIDHFEEKEINVDKSAEKIILSDHFKPTVGVIRRLAIIPGRSAVKDRSVGSICSMADVMGLKPCTIEDVCQFREVLGQKNLYAAGIECFTAFFENILTESPGKPQSLLFGHHDNDRDYLFSTAYNENCEIGKSEGAIFALPQD